MSASVSIRRVGVGIATVLVLVVAACGRPEGETETGPGVETETTQDTGGSATLATGEFGDLGPVCGPGDATGATDVGVTDTEIRIATFADPGFSGRPGLLQEFFDTAEAFTAWCNEAGGILGREVVVDLRDAQLTEYLPRILESCEQDLAMVGGGATFDDTGQVERLACGLVDISGFVVTATAAEADLLVQPVPNPVYRFGVGPHRWLEQEYPDAVDHVGILTGSLPTTRTVAARQKEAVESLGWDVVYEGQYNPAGEATWKPFAETLQQNDVEALIWVGEPSGLAKLKLAMEEIGYDPAFVYTDSNHYDPTLIETGGEAIERIYVNTAFYPFEEADRNPATQQYVDIMEEYQPDGKVALLGMQGFSAWLLFAKAATACGSDLTRECLYEEASAVSEWSGGGLHATTNPAERMGAPCFALVEATADGFVLVDVDATEGIFRCDPDSTVTLTGDYGEGAHLPT